MFSTEAGGCKVWSVYEDIEMVLRRTASDMIWQRIQSIIDVRYRITLLERKKLTWKPETMGVIPLEICENTRWNSD